MQKHTKLKLYRVVGRHESSNALAVLLSRSVRSLAVLLLALLPALPLLGAHSSSSDSTQAPRGTNSGSGTRGA